MAVRGQPPERNQINSVSIADNIVRVRQRIAAAAHRAGRNPDEITLMAVSKTFPPEAIRKAYELNELPKPAEIEAIAGAWRPYCSVAAWYLWRSLDG